MKQEVRIELIFNRLILIRAVDLFIYILKLLIIARIFVSFIIRDLRNPILRFLYQITEPLLMPFRTLIYKLGINTGMFDFSPILAFLTLDIIRTILF
ncbi:YggT family protein [Clostridiisalibacter paucivorans]|uniref:YggT family protein n=1 Tax=Clostridiisalibacter paucivorans TaxID=408753 RepID=UPI0009FF78A7